VGNRVGMKPKATVLVGLASTAMVFVPLATADVPGLAPFVGIWQKHDERLVIDDTGMGVDTYPDLTRCPTCSNGSAPGGTLTFTLTSVSDGVASGRVTASSDAENYPVGQPVTATLATGSPGELLQITVGRLQQLPFCDSTAESTGQCGA
jgi:hypothetical protein